MSPLIVVTLVTSRVHLMLGHLSEGRSNAEQFMSCSTEQIDRNVGSGPAFGMNPCAKAESLAVTIAIKIKEKNSPNRIPLFIVFSK